MAVPENPRTDFDKLILKFESDDRRGIGEVRLTSHIVVYMFYFVPTNHFLSLSDDLLRD